MIDLIVGVIVLLVWLYLVRKQVRQNEAEIEMNAKIDRFSDLFPYNANDP